MTPRTRAELILAARQRADMEVSEFVGDTEAVDMLQASWHELYDLLIEAYGENYFEIRQLLSFNPNSPGLDLMDLDTGTEQKQFYKLVRIGFVSGEADITLDREGGRSDRSTVARSWDVWQPPTYSVEGMLVRWHPLPAAQVTCNVSWVPLPAELADGDTLPQQAQPWEEYIIVDWAIKAMQKEESDVSMLMARRDQLIERIRKMAPRDIGTPDKIAISAGANGLARGWGW